MSYKGNGSYNPPSDANIKQTLPQWLIGKANQPERVQRRPRQSVCTATISGCQDKHVRLLELAAADERVFPEWTMVRVTQEVGLLQVCNFLGGKGPLRLDVSTTTALVSLMRNILLTGVREADGWRSRAAFSPESVGGAGHEAGKNSEALVAASQSRKFWAAETTKGTC